MSQRLIDVRQFILKSLILLSSPDPVEFKLFNLLVVTSYMHGTVNFSKVGSESCGLVQAYKGLAYKSLVPGQGSALERDRVKDHLFSTTSFQVHICADLSLPVLSLCAQQALKLCN